MSYAYALFIFISCSLFAKEEISAESILYLVRTKNYAKALTSYQDLTQGKHNPSLLEQIGCTILEQGALEEESELQLLSLFGSTLANVPFSIALLEKGITSPSTHVQMAALQFLSHLQDDRVEHLLHKALTSQDPFIALEAAYHLSARKAHAALGYVEALMNRFPREARYLFPELYALIDTQESINFLKRFLQDPDPLVRISAILSIGYAERDDLIECIRKSLSHHHPAEVEACAISLALLKDFASIPQLEKYALTGSGKTQLAAIYALYILGKKEQSAHLIERAKKHDLFAISLLSKIDETQDVLAHLTQSGDLSVRINAAMALVQHRDKRAAAPLMEILLKDHRDLALKPQFSTGHSLMTWKVVPSSTQYMKHTHTDLYSITLHQREKLLAQCIELPEKEFLRIADAIFTKPQLDLVPQAIALLENMQTEGALTLLLNKTKSFTHPLVRTYCHLALFRLKHKGSHAKALLDWLMHQKDIELIRLRTISPWNTASFERNPHEITPEETGRLCIDICKSYAENQGESIIDILLEMIVSGHPRNRYVLAGLLIHAIR